MRHQLLTAFVAISLLFNPLSIFAKSTAVDKVRASIVRILMIKSEDGQEHSCTGFVVAPFIILTANHCEGNPMVFDGNGDSKLIKADLHYDLAVWHATVLGKPAVKFRDKPVVVGETVTGIGFGYGWDIALVLPQTVSIPSYAVDKDAAEGIIVQGGYVGGMSGGPVFDKDGEVVGIIQRAVEKTGYGVATASIKEFLHSANIKGF